jgi:hypothetical protein
MSQWIEWIAKGLDWVNGLGAGINKMVAGAVKWGEDLISNFITGLENKLGELGNMMNKVASVIAGPLHFSKPDYGPLADADQWMKDFGDLLSKSLQEQAPKLSAASFDIAHSISAVNPANLPQGPNPGNSMGNAQVVQLLQRMVSQQEQQGRQQLQAPPNNTLGAMTQQFHNTFNGNMDPNAMQQIINYLQGLQVQYSQRGALFNY